MTSPRALVSDPLSRRPRVSWTKAVHSCRSRRCGPRHRLACDSGHAVWPSRGRIPSDRRFLAVASKRLRHLFPRIPGQAGYFKRRRRLTDTLVWLMEVFASESPGFYDDLLLVDSTPVECARSRETVKRSELGVAADYGYCASHSRFLWVSGD